MAVQRKKLPIGIEDFKEIRTNDFYYVDKTGLIRDLLSDWGKVNLFTRPRRFGKSLNMSMLRYFFEPGGDRSIFDGLAIMEEQEICDQYMGNYPVISVSLKSINGFSYEMAREMMAMYLSEVMEEYPFLLQSGKLTEKDRETYASFLNHDMNEAAICRSLKVLSRLLQKHYGQKVILLIDEYDVPLAKAFEQGYYDQMALLIRNLFEQVLKTNSSLQMAILTGCMRISKESIFTGLNNLQVFSVSDAELAEYFGFTDREVRELLSCYGLSGKYEKIRDWYDGYQFGGNRIYCPWDVICYCRKLQTTPELQPQNYWINTSGNDIVRRFIRKADTRSLQREIEALIAGETVVKTIHPELTYRDMYASPDNIWSVLYTTGYLTCRGSADGDTLALAIPNMEIRSIFTSQIMEFFRENVEKDGESLQAFCEALLEGDAAGVESRFTGYLKKTISIRDTFVKKQLKENFYHGILLGLLGFKSSWDVYSNREGGDGYSDIVAEIEERQTGIIIEVKYSEDGNLERDCRAALKQIAGKRYAERFYDDEIRTVLKYGIACYKKRCRAAVEKETV